MANVNNLSKLTLLLSIFSLPLAAANLTLKPATVNAWNSYLQEAETKIVNAPPLRIATDRSSTVKVRPGAGSGTVAVPEGLIHDWVGTTFVPNVTIAQLQAVIHDYDHYKDIYTPTVVDSKALEVGNATESFSMEWFQKVLHIATGIDADYSNTVVTQHGDSGYVITRSTRVQEIRNFGRDDQEKLPVGTGNGFVWRVSSILRYEQVDGGVYLQLEALVLSREIPRTVRWVANPVVNHLSRNSITATLNQTVEAVQTRSARLSGDSLAQAR
jgi:hypothetical protein